MAKDDQVPEKPAEALASEFVSSLGLSDVIIGGLAIYSRYVGAHQEFTSSFPSTGYGVLNIALLVCAAALVGKVLSIVIATVMAIVNVILRVSNITLN